MSRHPNKVHMERCFSEPKICSNCNLQYADEFWVFECLCGCNSAARVCKSCIVEHAGVFSRRDKICFHCKLVKCERILVE